MAFPFIYFKYLLNLTRKLGVDFTESLADILMYSTFGNTELFCGTSYRCLIFDNKPSEKHCTVIRLDFHAITPILLIGRYCGMVRTTAGLTLYIYMQYYVKRVHDVSYCETVRKTVKKAENVRIFILNNKKLPKMSQNDL